MDALRSPCLILQTCALGFWTLAQAAADPYDTHTTSAAVTTHAPPPSAVIGLLGDLAFGSLPAGQTATRTLVITNSGNLALNVWGISCPPTFNSTWSGSIAPASSQTVPVTFSPADQAIYGGTLVVSNDATSGSGSLPISGTGYFPLTNYWSIWWQNTNGSLALWSMLGTNRLANNYLNPPSPGLGWRLAGTTEFNADNHNDLLFESSGGGVATWLMNGCNRQTNSYLTPATVDAGWMARGTADLDGDGGHDILWQRGDGSVAAWLMNGLVATQTVRLNPPQVDPGWSLAGTGDFNSDSKSDILWQNTDGRLAIWFMNGTNRSSTSYLNPGQADSGWRLAGSLDFNADGHPGLLWEHTSGALAYWQMAGTNLVHSGRLNPALVDPAWQLVGPSAQAAGTIDTPTQAALETALSGGGVLMFTCNGTIVLTNTLLISHDTILDGNGYAVTISGGGNVRIFQVAAGVNFWLKGLTLSDGRVMAPNGADGSPPSPGQDALGGAILCQGGNLTLTDCTLSNNFVQGGHGGNETNEIQGASGGMGAGGAIYASEGTLSLTNCSLLSSMAIGGVGSMFTPPGYPVSTGAGPGGNACGGAIYMSNVTATFAQVTFASNKLVSGAAQMGVDSIQSPGGNALGGAVCLTNSTVLIVHSSFATNIATAANPTNYNAASWGSQSGGGVGGALWVSQGSTATIQSSSFSNNTARGGVGALRLLYGGPGMGGAIASSGTLLLSDCAVSGNWARSGNSTFPAPPGRGGGVYAEGPLTMNRCTFDDNQAIGGDAGYLAGQGGAGEGGALWSSAVLMATNCTFATNTAIGGPEGSYLSTGGPGRGGAIFASGGGMLVDLTLAYNRADSSVAYGLPPGPTQGGGLAVTNSPLTARGTIIANSPNGGDVWGVVTDAGYNICSDGTAGFTATNSFNNINPLLGPLANNGGPTQTIALESGSPAIDKIASGFPPTDQRGFARPQGAAADIGAYEAPISLTIARSGSNVAISFYAQGGITYELLTSADLRNWISVATNSIPNSGPLSFVQAYSPGANTFYRVVVR
jgi:hypothetical protein